MRIRRKKTKPTNGQLAEAQDALCAANVAHDAVVEQRRELEPELRRVRAIRKDNHLYGSVVRAWMGES